MGLFSLGGVWNYFSEKALDAYKALTDVEVCIGEHYSVLRHSRPFVIYAGIKTQVPISIFGDHVLPAERRVFLQRRGYRTGLLGWTLGSLLGGAKLPGIEVTPATEITDLSLLSNSEKNRFEKDVRRSFPPSKAESHKPLERMIVHIPVSSGDGYFRLRVTSDNSRKTLAVSPVFRIGSISWASAHPQGASIIGLFPELLVRTSFIAARTSVYASFYAAFPLLKVAELTPGPWKQYALRILYSHALSEEQRGNLTESITKGKAQLRKANDSIYTKVPFGAVGVRTLQDLQKDEELGRGGVWYYLNHAASSVNKDYGHDISESASASGA